MSLRDTSELHTWGDGDEEDDKSALQLRYPRWRIWRGRSERGEDTGWYATRAMISAEQNRGGLHCTLDAGTADELKGLLEEQEKLIRGMQAPAIPSAG